MLQYSPMINRRPTDMEPVFTSDTLRLSAWIETASRLETSHAHFVAADIPATRQRIHEMTQGRCRFTVADPGPFVQFREAHAYAGALAIKFLRWNCEGRCETRVTRGEGHHLSLHIPLTVGFEARQGDVAVATQPGEMLIVSAPGVIRRSWEGPCDLLNLAINRATAQTVFAHLPAGRALLDAPLTVVDLRAHATLAAFIENLVRDLGRPAPSFSAAAALPHVERLLLTLIAEAMGAARGLAADQGGPHVAPWYVLRAEEYMRSHYAGRVRMGDVARACGVSVRALHYGFARFRGRGPAEALRDIRLAQARHALIEARLTGLKVAEIARRAGFPNASQFSRDYRAHFGESPSATSRAAFG
jgi:AraC-like DNA-binding protein